MKALLYTIGSAAATRGTRAITPTSLCGSADCVMCIVFTPS
jgi:hypothetical protein